jgi:hypothetical protein
MCGVLDMTKNSNVPPNRERRSFMKGDERQSGAAALSLSGAFIVVGLAVSPVEESASRDIARFREGAASQHFGPAFLETKKAKDSARSRFGQLDASSVSSICAGN